MPGKRAITKQSLPDVIANDLRDRILSGDLEEGEAIRQEALATEYEVSRMPIREALKRLNTEGLIQWANNKGGSVTKHSLSEIGEMFDLRSVIEVDLFRRAIPKMDATDFARCAEILAQMDTSYDENNVGQWGQLNHQYHLALYSASERKLTNEILDRINLQSDRYVRMHLSVMKQREPARKEHRELLELAREGKVEVACELLKKHIERTKEELLELIAMKRKSEKD
jgi:DNA-binding GntR family transcriptional regulator